MRIHLTKWFGGRSGGIFTNTWQSFKSTESTAQNQTLRISGRAAPQSDSKHQTMTTNTKQFQGTVVIYYTLYYTPKPKSETYKPLEDGKEDPRIEGTAPIDENRRRVNAGLTWTLILPGLETSAEVLKEVAIPESLKPERMEVGTAITILINQ